MRVASGILKEAEVGRLLSSAQAVLRDYLLLRILYLTGLRRAEMVAVLSADVLWDCNALYIRSGKEDKDRYVLLDPTTMQLLAEYLKDVEPERPIFKHTGKWVHDVFLIYGNKTGLIAEYAARGLRLSPHSLRYAFATHFYDHGLHLDILADLLGHVLPQDTVNYLITSRARLELAYRDCNPFSKSPIPAHQPAPQQIPSQAMVAEAYREREREFRSQPRAGRTNGVPMIATPPEIATLLNQSAQPYQLFFRTLYASGLWAEDALGAKIRHFNAPEQEIRMGKQLALLDPETTEQIALAVAGRQPDDPIFPLQKEAAKTHLQECATQTGLAQRLAAAQAPIHLDTLRQAFAAHSAARGLDTITLMRLLGHHFFTTTQPYLQAAIYRELPAYLRAQSLLNLPLSR